MADTILIIDFGSQVTQLIARRLREAGVYTEILPCTTDPENISAAAPQGIILSGGPNSVAMADTPRAPQIVFDMQIPVLGICYGQQTMCQQLGGRVEPGTSREFGRAELDVTEHCALFDGLWDKGTAHTVWMSHGDHVAALPDGFRVVGKSDGAPFAAVADESRHYYGVQFHPEVVHTKDGDKVLSRFALDICGCSGSWSMAAYRSRSIEAIRKQVGDGKVICGLSGGVDSSVTAVLLHEAIGDQLTCVFVDHGLLRKGEAEEVVSLFGGHYNIPLIHRNVSDMFLERLAGVSDPEQKRKIIGGSFIEVFDEEAQKIDGARFLAQGTLYPDVIESISAAGGSDVTIKSHHNVGGLPDNMKLDLVEPLRELFKDEVRNLGRELGLPEVLVSRHPFPGPGLAIRVPGEITPEKLDILREADAVYLDEIRKAGLYDDIWQAFAVLLPVKTVGVMGDARSYEYVCALRAVTSSDGMTAESYGFSHEFLARTATRIINAVKGVNRVVYDVTSKPPGTIEWE
ncbi:glutamine-hydrolyzing GMP synthase [Candidatus Puniceispirillum sp.]|jgi:GMP synthase (glutamine-hydrolysing)|uniref:glutamine-hydrolyzing GMP synthase n=1 Tax=Candidatus Puniceispirillum sp. TaxID=2026719 RepID=UPI001EBA8B16|nr:glutamine-hydrolyzing GMP synthase [Candidatus Puniceispirillum sp.]